MIHNMDLSSKIWVAGSSGMLGSAVVRKLRRIGHTNVITRCRRELDLRFPTAIDDFFYNTRPEYVFMCAAKVGGIGANTSSPVEYLYENTMVNMNVLKACLRFNVRKVCFVGSSCIYPRECPQPIKESYLGQGAHEPTNEGYALSKILGIRFVQSAYTQYGAEGVCPIPCNLHGPGMNFDLEASHVMGAVVRKVVDAQVKNLPGVRLWGDGSPVREFMHVDDAARACVLLTKHFKCGEVANVGTGIGTSIHELAERVIKVAGYTGKIEFENTSQRNGMPHKVMDVSVLKRLGFVPNISLDDGIREMIEICRAGCS